MTRWRLVRNDKYFISYNEQGQQMGMFLAEYEHLVMFRYGKSKTMHWNDLCARPNANAEPQELTMRDGWEQGIKPCRNCWHRTRNVNSRRYKNSPIAGTTGESH